MQCLAQDFSGIETLIWAMGALCVFPAIFGLAGLIIMLIHFGRLRLLSDSEEGVGAGLPEELLREFIAVSRKACGWAIVGGMLFIIFAVVYFYLSPLEVHSPGWAVHVGLTVAILAGACFCLFVGAVFGSRAKRMLRQGSGVPRQ